MNDEVKQGEVIQAAERESEQRATNAQLAAEPARAETAPGGAAQTESRAAERPQAEAAQGDAPQGDAEAQRAESAAEVPQVPDQDNPEFRELQQAVAEGRDLSKELEPPAAGEGGGSSDSIAAGVRFERDPNARDPRAGFDPDYTPPPLPDPTANTSPVVAVVEPPPPPPDNGVAIGGLTPAAEGGDVSVNEAHLTDGSAPNPPALTQTGSFTVSAPDGLGSLTIGGVLVLDANGLTGNPVTTPLGNTLLVTGYDPVTGEVTYEYTLGDNESHPPGQGANDLFDNLPVVLTDSDGDTTEQQLAVRIVDDLPNAISDIDEVGTGGSTGGNVFTGTDDDPLDRVEADVPGADRTASPITGVIAGEHLDAPITDGSGVGAVIDGQFGTLVLNADGSYVYTADGGLVSNQTEVFTYTLTDADGDTDTATLTIRIQGEAPPPPPPPPPDNPVDISDLTPAGEGGDASVNEANLSDGSAPNPPALTQTGTFTISVPDGLGSLTIGGVVVLNAGGLTGATVTTPLGNTLVVTGYNPATGVVSYEYTLGDNEGHPLGDGTNDLFDQMPVVLTDSDGDTDSDTLSVRIVDDVPTAVDDTDSIAAGSVGPALGNVISDAEGDGGADTRGADGAQVSGVASNNVPANSDFVADGSGNFSVVGQYGTLTLNQDGSYSYLRNAGTPGGVSDVFTYTLTDGDGDSDTATLTISLGNDEPTLLLPTPGSEEAVVSEAGLGPRGLEPAGTAEMSDDDPSNDSSQAEKVEGTINFTPGDTPAVVSIGGVDVTAVGQTFAGAYGTLTITGMGPTSIGYRYTLTDNTLGNGAHDDFSVVVTDADNDQASGTLRIDIVDDRPHATDFNGTIKDTAGQSLVGLIEYGLGADGFGGVSTTFTGATSNGAPIALKSNGSSVTVASVDVNGDGLQEVLGFIDSGTSGYDAGDHLVFSLAPTLSGAAYGKYALTLHDVLDLQAETQTFTVGTIRAGGPTTGIVVNDGNGGSIGVLATPESGHEVNSNTGELGIDNTILNANVGGANYDEKITLAFGTAFSGTTITEKAILNDVRITGVNVGSGADSFDWVAYKGGSQVGAGSGNVMSTVSGQNLIGDPIHVEGGYDTLVLTMVSGDFKMSGFTYSQQGESFDTILNFSYTATDGDADAVSGSFNVTVTDDAAATTGLAPGVGDLATITSIGTDYVAP